MLGYTKNLNITGGAYKINYEDEKLFETFIKHYSDTVFKKKRSEYITEVQDRENGGPILADLDFKLDKEQCERVFDKEVIDDIVQTYVETINEKFNLSNINIIQFMFY